MQPIFISVSEAGTILGLGRTKIYEIIKNQELRSTRIGGRRLVEFASVERFAHESLQVVALGDEA
jgi:excisionase family DNA binding protein